MNRHSTEHEEQAWKTYKDTVKAMAVKKPDAGDCANKVMDALDDNTKALIFNRLAFNAVRADVLQERSSVRQEYSAGSVDWEVRRKAVVATNRCESSILDRWMVGNKRLGDCTREDLLAAIESYESDASGKLIRAKFLKQIVQMMPGKQGAIVRKELTAVAIEKVKKQVGAAA